MSNYAIFAETANLVASYCGREDEARQALSDIAREDPDGEYAVIEYDDEGQPTGYPERVESVLTGRTVTLYKSGVASIA